MALLPDIDQARSKLGNLAKPVSRAVQKGFGHRTITHSWVILLVPSLLFGNSPAAMAALWGILSHLISDMLVGRIQLFWPLRFGWIGIPLSKRMYSAIDQIVFYAALGYIVYTGYQ